MPFDLNSLSLYPQDPGVYLMKNQEGIILYIGKAKNLRNRLKQYFAIHGDERTMIPYLVAQIEKIDTIITITEKDALLLENTLIKKHQPKYNVLLKDDKTFISLVMTEHEWPRLKLVRYKGLPKEKGTYFGPYTNALAAKQTLDLLLRLFPLRQCSDTELLGRVRPCLLYDIKRCIAPCMKLCTKEEYAQYVDSAERLLRGKDKDVLRALETEMEKAADNLEFEKAHDLLTLIHQIKHVTEVKHVDHPEAKDCDALGIYRESGTILITLLMFREGKVVGAEHFSFSEIAESEEEILSSFLVQHYQLSKAHPKEILLPQDIPDLNLLEEILQIKIRAPKKGRKHDLIEMSMRNAKALFIREQDSRSLKEKKLLDLAEVLQLSRFPRRIECFDTSNISGTDPVASLVSFVHGEKDSSRMRLFKVKSGGDDYTAMREVLERHFKKAKEKNDFCDLLIVDGGKGQLNIALQVLQALDIATVDVIGFTKEDARHDKGLTQEKIYLSSKKEPLFIDVKSPLLFLLQKIRDEAHKQAIQYHRKRRSKRILSSELDDIKGIGPVKKKNLLKHFGSVANLKKAKEEEISQVQGITKRDLTILISWLKRL